MLKIEVNEGSVLVNWNGRVEDVMCEFLCAMLGTYNEWKATDEKLGDHLKKLVEKAAKSEAGFWDIKAESASGTRVIAHIPRPRKEGESYGGEAVSI